VAVEQPPAGTLLERLQVIPAVFELPKMSFLRKECRSMRVHIDRKWLDGDVIAFVVISLLIVIAFVY
jgi:hypothetical protein